MRGVTSDDDLHAMAAKLNIMLNGVYFKNELPRIPHEGNYIINMASSDDGSGGTHWTCVRLEDNGALYFDPFGIPEPRAVNDFMMKWVHNDTKKIIRNQRDVQNISSNWCGQWCIACLSTLEFAPGSLQQRLNDFLESFRDYSR